MTAGGKNPISRFLVRSAKSIANDPDLKPGGPPSWFAAAERLRLNGDVEQAILLYQRIVDSGHGRLALMSAYHLGFLLADRGDDEEAVDALRVALDLRKPKFKASAALKLGLLLQATGDDAEGIRNAFKLAVGAGDKDCSPWAAYLLGCLYLDESDTRTARPYLQMAVDSGHPEWAPRSAFRLGVMLEEAGDLQAAQAAWSTAADSGHADTKVRALVKMSLAAMEVDSAMAEATLREAAAVDAPQWAAIVHYHLGKFLYERDAEDEAWAAFMTSVEADDPQWSPSAMVGLGLIRAHRGDYGAARRWYELAADSDDAETVEKATERLAELPD
jgi:tetratricopeptide (TPR) repeat protein